MAVTSNSPAAYRWAARLFNHRKRSSERRPVFWNMLRHHFCSRQNDHSRRAYRRGKRENRLLLAKRTFGDRYLCGFMHDATRGVPLGRHFEIAVAWLVI